jgi:hypothetical protein
MKTMKQLLKTFMAYRATPLAKAMSAMVDAALVLSIGVFDTATPAIVPRETHFETASEKL